MDDRHLPASERKRQRLRAQGDVAKSHEANSTLVFLTLMVVSSKWLHLQHLQFMMLYSLPAISADLNQL